MTLQTPLVLAAGEGEHWHFLNTLQTIKLGGDRTGGVLSVVEFEGPRGFGPPLHSHDVEDELFYVLDGEVRFTSGDVETVGAPGTTVWLPKHRPHQFQVLSETAKVFQVTTPAQFDDFVRTLGEPASEARIPDPVAIDGGHVAEVCAQFQIQVLGPPPAPLE